MGQDNSQLKVIRVDGEVYGRVKDKGMNYMVEGVELYQSEGREDVLARVGMHLPRGSNQI